VQQKGKKPLDTYMLQQVELMRVAREMLLTWIYINQNGIIVMEMGVVGRAVFKANRQDLTLESKRICVEHSDKFVHV
jgi:hypothetical protein